MELFSSLSWTTILGAAALLFIIIGIWVGLQYWLNPTYGTIDEPDATADLKGSCGDSMKLSLSFRNGRVVDAKYWTNGCRMSNACGAAAAKLALNKTPEEIADIDHVAIEKFVGGLPQEESHCATLAAGTLQECLRRYLVGS